MSRPVLNFFAVAFDRYKLFVAPYIVSCLYFNKQACAEILVEDVSYFRNKQLDFLKRNFGDRVLIRKFPKKFENWRDSKRRKSIRWLTVPKKRVKYTYIGDIDILILDENLHNSHVEHAGAIGKPYSNLLRPNGINMSGLHFVITDPYYEKVNNTYLNSVISKVHIGKIKGKQLDERLLCKIVKETHGLPSKKSKKYRPIHGIHWSLRRPLVKWCATGRIPSNFEKLISTELWKEGMDDIFDNKFKKIVCAYLDRAVELGRRNNQIKSRIIKLKETIEKESKELRSLQAERGIIYNTRFKFKNG